MDVSGQQFTQPKATGTGARWRIPVARISIPVLSIALGILAWAILAREINAPALFASPEDTFLKFVALAKTGVLVTNVVASLKRILVGFVLGSAIGIPLGIAMASSELIYDFAKPYIFLFRFIPPIAILPLLVIWMGIDNASKYAVIAFATLFIVVINTIAGVVAVPEVKVRAAKTLGLTRLQIIRYVILPSAVPFIATGLRIAMGNAFAVVVSAEMISANNGLGTMILMAQQFFETAIGFLGILTLGVTGLVFDFLFRVASKALLHRYALHDI
jgi:NitT/TauT family transport system permease protein